MADGNQPLGALLMHGKEDGYNMDNTFYFMSECGRYATGIMCLHAPAVSYNKRENLYEYICFVDDLPILASQILGKMCDDIREHIARVIP